MADNELIVLIYETLQKQLNEMKNSRIVIQSLCDRVSKLEKTMETLNERSDEIENRLEVTSMIMKALNDTTSSSKTLTSTVNALRGTIEHVTNPSISLIATVHKDIKKSMRDLTAVHKDVMDEFEQYELRLAIAEDRLNQIRNNTLLKEGPEEKKTSEEKETDE